MSGRLIAGKPLLLLACCASLGVAGVVAMGLKSGAVPMAQNAPSPLAKSCIALAIDRETGTTTAVPCAGTPTLLAGQARAAHR